MPKVYQIKYCVRCGRTMRVCKPTFVCPTCPLSIKEITEGGYFDYQTGERIITKIIKFN